MSIRNLILANNQLSPPTPVSWNSVALWLTGDDLVDKSASPKTVTNNGSVTVDTTIKKHGTGSIKCDGSNFLSVPGNDFAFGSGNFTIEFWLYFTGHAATNWSGSYVSAWPLSGGYQTGNGWSIGPAGNRTEDITFGSQLTSVTGFAMPAVSLTPYKNTWVHYAVVRNGSTITQYLNGESKNIYNIGSNSLYFPTTPPNIRIGKWDTAFGGSIFNMDDLRISKNTAVYTSNFTPPSEPLKPVPPTVIYPEANVTPITTLLLNGDGTNGAQNNTFIDSSTNNATITRYGDVTQGSFGPFGNSWCNYFDGSGDYLQTPVTASTTMNTSDFTIECWYYPVSVTSATPYIITRGGLVANGWTLGERFSSTANNEFFTAVPVSGTQFTFHVSNLSPSVILTSTTPVYNNQWYHLAVTRSGSSWKLFVNGVQEATYTSNTALDGNVTADHLYIGSGTNSNISNVRIIKGTALYTENFTPSTSPLTAVSGTSLLTCNSISFKDNSVNNAAITRVGDVKVVKDSPFPEVYDNTIQGGSAYFDGTGDYLTSNVDTSVISGAGDFTLESWIYPQANTTYHTIYATTNVVGTSTDYPFELYYQGGFIKLYCKDSAGSFIVNGFTSSQAVPINTWTHIAVVRSGSTFTIYINGVASGTASSAASIKTQLVAKVGWVTSTYYFNGYISNLRIIKGTALYTSNFTPSTTPLTAVANTSLLLKCDNAGIVDASGKNNLVTYGNAQISTAVKKYGTGAMYFDGTGDYLTSNNGSSLPSGTGDFTVEFWVNWSNVTGRQIIITGNSSNSFYISKGTNSTAENTLCVGKALVESNESCNFTFANNTWYHIAVVRQAAAIKFYVNGNQQATVGTGVGVFDIPSPSWYTVGWSAVASPTFNLNGYIDDLRITKGVARYTGNFTPPTTPLSL